MKYYLDEDLNPAIAAAGRSLGVDVVSAHERGARGLTDEEQLAHAATERRCIVTYNRDDFITVTRRMYDKARPHYGVLIVPPQVRYSRPSVIAKALAAHAARFGTQDYAPYSIDFLKTPNRS
jgi:predicted nuclease of predicted toxin-antitoxin system